MPDPTTTAPAAIGALVADLGAAMTGPNSGVHVYEAWPGPNGSGRQNEMVILGPVTWETYEIATIKPGRQQRTEEYTIGFAIFVLGAEGASPSVPAPVRVRAFDILGVIEDVLAEEPDPASVPTVAWLQVRPGDAGIVPYETSWGYQIQGTIPVTARLN